MAKIADDDRDVDCSDSEQHGLVPGFQWYQVSRLPSNATTSIHGSSGDYHFQPW